MNPLNKIYTSLINERISKLEEKYRNQNIFLPKEELKRLSIDSLKEELILPMEYN